jgi:hypothetical protein
MKSVSSNQRQVPLGGPKRREGFDCGKFLPVVFVVAIILILYLIYNFVRIFFKKMVYLLSDSYLEAAAV